jgi:hypothetical protein
MCNSVLTQNLGRITPLFPGHNIIGLLVLVGELQFVKRIHSKTSSVQVKMMLSRINLGFRYRRSLNYFYAARC